MTREQIIVAISEELRDLPVLKQLVLATRVYENVFVKELQEIKTLFEECQIARDESGYLGTVPDCIRYWVSQARGD